MGPVNLNNEPKKQCLHLTNHIAFQFNFVYFSLRLASEVTYIMINILTSHPYDIARVSLSHTDDLLTPPYDITTAVNSYGRLNISSV